MLKNRVFYVLLLAAAALIYIFTNTYYTLTLLAVCVVMPVISLVLMLIAGREIAIELELPQTAEKKAASLTYRISNPGRYPVARITFQIRLENQMTGAFRERRVSATAGSRETVTAELSLQNSKVGTVVVSTNKIRVYDAFGLFVFRKSDLPDQAVIIYPDMRNVEVHMENPVENTGDGSRYSPDRPGQDVSEIFALREYVPGDEIRKIHWKLSGKTDRTMVRDFSLPLNYSVFLLLELTRGSEELVDAQVEIFLALSRTLLENGISHNMGWYDAAEERFNVEELDDFEELELAAAGVLSSYAVEESGAALDFYSASGYRSRSSILLYVVTEPKTDKIAELEVYQRMKTILIYEDETAAKTAEEEIEAVTVSVKEAAGSMPEIIV
ncbi:MAG: DUF58 domain-containing protein [Clostridiales bacterium]|nr:DUF58 domain-containing protein [Clostridiales bacterium]